MEDKIFIKKIELNNFLHHGKIQINISENERKHLIITGKNGSGKTSLLKLFDEIVNFDIGVINEETSSAFSQPSKREFEVNEKIKIVFFEGKQIHEINELVNRNNFIYKYLIDFKKFEPEKSKSIEPVNFDTVADINRDFSKDFVKYLFFQDYRISRAKQQTQKKYIENWFVSIKNILRKIYNDEKLELEPNIEINDFDFYIKLSNGNRFNFNQLAAGYSSILNIVIELLLRSEICEQKHLTQGIVLIDEPEAHLHIELQKEIMPFLTEMFPNIQFIVATHSPFVLSSLENAVVYDLENNILIDNISDVPSIKLIEKYFTFDKEQVEDYNSKIEEFVILIEKPKRTQKEADRIAELDIELNKVIYCLSDEMHNKFRISQSKIYKND